MDMAVTQTITPSPVNAAAEVATIFSFAAASTTFSAAAVSGAGAGAAFWLENGSECLDGEHEVVRVFLGDDHDLAAQLIEVEHFFGDAEATEKDEIWWILFYFSKVYVCILVCLSVCLSVFFSGSLVFSL